MASPLLTGAGIAAGIASPLAIVTGIASVVGGIGAVVGAGFGIANFFQSKKILKAVQQTMQVAELNLAVTRTGFMALDQRLIALEQTLRQIKDSVTTIQRLLESTHRAELRTALEHLELLPTLNDERVRIEVLTHSATNLGKLRHVYFDQLHNLAVIPDALATEEYFLIAALAQARCYAELREPAMAKAILTEVVNTWRVWARIFARVALIGDHPQRFLYGDLASSAPLPMIATWLDFSYDKQEGLTAIEELRTRVKPWYYHRSTDGEPTEARRFNTVSACEYRLAHDRERVIPALNKLVTRNAVLSGYEGQYALMEHLRMTPGELEASIQAKAPAATGDDDSMLVLMMAEAAG